MPRKTAKRTNKRSTYKRITEKRNKSKTNKRQNPKVKIINSGFIKTVTTVNNKKSEEGINWDGKYDGQKAVFHAKLNKDGKTENIEKTFSNNDIKQLLGYSVVNEPLEMRLKQLSSNPGLRSEKLVPVILNDDADILFEEPKQQPSNMRQFTIKI
jgi:hypothetical protein